MANNVEIFNSVRDLTSNSFKSRIPKADSNNMTEIGMLLTKDAYTADFNEWLTQAINRIGLVLIHNAEIKNRLGRFVYGTMEFGDAIEELMTQVIKGEDYNAGTTSVDPFRITNPDVKAYYHKVNSRRVYRVTTYPDRAKRAFTSPDGLQTLISQIVSQLYSGAELDDWLSMKNVFNVFLDKEADNYATVNVTDVTDEQTAKDFVTSIKNTITAQTFPTSAYNISGTTKMIDPADLTIFVRADLLNYIDVNVLASAYNRSDLSFTPNGSSGQVKIEPVDNFGGLYPVDSSGSQLYPLYDGYGKQTGKYTNTQIISSAQPIVEVNKWVDPHADVLAIMCEDRFPIITRQLERADSIWNPEGLYWNNFLHRWSQYGYSGFMNCVVIKKQ